MVELALHGRVAVLIDADNVQLDYLTYVLRFASYFGKITTKNAYGDWEKTPLQSHVNKVKPLGIDLVQVNRNGKNATDHRLLMDIGALLNSGANSYHFNEVPNTFVLVSSDGDFASAAEYIGESARAIGIGHKAIVSDALRRSCEQFYFLEDLKKALGRLKAQYPIPPDDVRSFFLYLFHAYRQLDEHNERPWVSRSQLGQKLREVYPNYDKRFGKFQFSTWLKQFTEYYEMQAQMVRRLDPSPEETRKRLIAEAYNEVRQDGRAKLSQVGSALRRLARDYDEQFGNKQLSKWVREYPEIFKIEGHYVIIRSDW